MGILIPLGIEDFADLRKGGYYYVDKTAFIKEFLSQQLKVNLVTRPRRFRKSLMISMLEVLIANLCKKYAFLGENDKVNKSARKLFKQLEDQEENEQNLKDSLAVLTRMMTAYYGKPAILLIDEYDAPLDKAHSNGYYKEMLDVIRAMMGSALKSNSYLKFGVVTGCLKISKESIFTGINNFVANTITVDRFDESIGFTEPEVQALLSATGYSDHAKEVRGMTANGSEAWMSTVRGMC